MFMYQHTWCQDCKFMQVRETLERTSNWKYISEEVLLSCFTVEMTPVVKNVAPLFKNSPAHMLFFLPFRHWRATKWRFYSISSRMYLYNIWYYGHHPHLLACLCVRTPPLKILYCYNQDVLKDRLFYRNTIFSLKIRVTSLIMAII